MIGGPSDLDLGLMRELVADSDVMTILTDVVESAYFREDKRDRRFDPNLCVGQAIYRSLVKGLGRLEELDWQWSQSNNAVSAESPPGRYSRVIRLVVWAGTHFPPSHFEVNRKGPISKGYIQTNRQQLAPQLGLWGSVAESAAEPITIPLIHRLNERRLKAHLALGMDLTRSKSVSVYRGLVAVACLVDRDMDDLDLGVGAPLPTRPDRPRPVDIDFVIEEAGSVDEASKPS